MNKNGLHQTSPVQQLMAAGGPNCWNINTMRPQNSPPPPSQHSSVLALPPPNQVPQIPLSSMSAWNDTHQEPTYQSLSQLLMGGILSEDKSALSHMQKLDILEEQFLQQEDSSNGSNFVDHVKQENLANQYHMYGTTSTTTSHGITANAETQQVNIAKPSWSQVMSVSSPTSCVTSLSTSNMLDFSNIKDGRHPPPDRSSEVRKEKLGDRITALHQLVSPFGKTDTASVLSEALGYIRFLQSQIEALSLPYLGSVSAVNNSRQPQSESIEEVKDLKSKGLCLVPISCTVQVGSENGADYWAPASF
ncbi:transcription factor bHLH68-like isoform X2 [Apium graveolens]|uniref:transcription factor bHLH68-like isoform X2 n=1 Tax=Apium graveolens TaxID=4045 RepID=UPI003D7B43E0